MKRTSVITILAAVAIGNDTAIVYHVIQQRKKCCNAANNPTVAVNANTSEL